MVPQVEAPVMAVDVGGTKILTALFSADGRKLNSGVRPTMADQGVNAVIERICQDIAGLLEWNNLVPPQLGGICIACAGGIDMERGLVTSSPNLPGWKDVPLAGAVRNRFGVETLLVNDASAAALGEHRYGAGRSVKDLVLLTLGTGIGGGIIIDGKLYTGSTGAAGELGHMTIAADGPRCTCGSTGCLEVMASGTAVERDAIERIKSGEESMLSGMAGGDVDAITAKMVGDAAGRGDELSKDVLARAAHYLGIGLANVVNIFDPEMIIIGGGMVGLGDSFIDRAAGVMRERAFVSSVNSVQVVPAQLGNEAGVYGAAAYMLEHGRRR